MFTKINQVILHSILIVTPCVLAGNGDQDPGQKAANQKYQHMETRLHQLKNENSAEDYVAVTMRLSGAKDDNANGARLLPGLIFGGLVDLFKAPAVAVKHKLADVEIERLNDNLTLIREISIQGSGDQANLEKLHKHYAKKSEFNGLTTNTLISCMLRQLKEPIPDNDLTNFKSVDFKSDSFKRRLLDAHRDT